MMHHTVGARVRHALGIKTDTEITREVITEPKIKEARRQLKRVDRILAELEALEGERAHS